MQPHAKRLFLVVGLTALLLSGAREARAWQWEIRLGGDGLYSYTASLQALTASHSVGGFSLFFAGQIWQDLFGEFGYTSSWIKGRTFDEFSNELDLHRLVFALRYDFPVLSFLTPYVRAGGQIAWPSLEIRAGGETLKARDCGAAGQPGAGGLVVGAGVELLIPRNVFKGKDAKSIWRDFTMGVRLELGYEALFGINFDDAKADATATRDDKEASIPRRSLPVGDVSVHGWTLRGSIVIHF